MATAPMQIRVDEKVKRDAGVLFNDLGLDMSSAVNIFLRQCLIHGGLPFAVEIPRYRKDVYEAMAEAKRISRDPSVKGFTSMDELKESLER